MVEILRVGGEEKVVLQCWGRASADLRHWAHGHGMRQKFWLPIFPCTTTELNTPSQTQSKIGHEAIKDEFLWVN
jgi:hypothetical protein